jgi:D-alanine-D-alanine ligase
VLGGGPDAEREVSLTSSQAVADAINQSGRFTALREVIDTLSIDTLRALRGDIIFPVLHGGWGEGGPLQDLLEFDGRPFVGSMSRAARQAMDKLSTKLVALRLGIPTTEGWVLDRRDNTPPCALPLVIKPVHEGSTIGLYVCRTMQEWADARRKIDQETEFGTVRSYLIEPMIAGETPAAGRTTAKAGRELTVGIIDGHALPIIEIVPAEGLYDYEAKYTREDTDYRLDPALPAGVKDRIQDQTARIARALGVRHVARADFMLDAFGTPWFLEINTMPGFTSHSLVPKAAAHAGIPMPELCARLSEMAVRDHVTSASGD